jgi:transcriptional regulator with XRE-family HTH domain
LLRQHRISAGLTQEQLAERAGLSVYGVQKLEAGTTHPYRDTAQRLIGALELAPDAAERLKAAVQPVRRHGSAPRGATDRAARHNLPAAVTSFVGRAHEMREIPKLLRTARLVTLTGPGGSGKTRLAVEIARRLVDHHRDGAWLVELAQVQDPALVPHRLAAVMGLSETANRPAALARALCNSKMLVVLDNCEHLLDGCATFVDLLLKECPMLYVLATSREALGIPGEISCAVPSLETPAAHLSHSLGDVRGSPAVQLFVDRASANQSDFSLVADNAPAISQICRRLDGIPLALELGSNWF